MDYFFDRFPRIYCRSISWTRPPLVVHVFIWILFCILYCAVLRLQNFSKIFPLPLYYSVKRTSKANFSCDFFFLKAFGASVSLTGLYVALSCIAMLFFPRSLLPYLLVDQFLIFTWPQERLSIRSIAVYGKTGTCFRLLSWRFGL